MNGAEYIAEFLRQRGSDTVFLLTGGACAFVVDAIARNPGIDYFCFQHEQAAAIAADAVWRINGKVGVTRATSGPGATNLLTGIACSYFDSIPAIHITGQVNQTSKKLDSDIVNDRTNAVNRVNPLSPGAGDLGSVKLRVPLQLDMSLQRNTPDIVSAVESNPLNQSLRQNAERDNEYLQRMLQSGSRA